MAFVPPRSRRVPNACPLAIGVGVCALARNGRASTRVNTAGENELHLIIHQLPGESCAPGSRVFEPCSSRAMLPRWRTLVADRAGWSQRNVASDHRTRRNVGFSHQPRVDSTRCLAAFPDRPDDERLPGTEIPAREDARNGRHVVAISGHVAALVELDAEIVDRPAALGAEKAERQ